MQNGVQPNRVSLLELSPDGTTIARGRIVEMNHPVFDEPTLGTVVDDVRNFVKRAFAGALEPEGKAEDAGRKTQAAE